MKISLLCSNSEHPVYLYLERWREANALEHDIFLTNKKSNLPGGDILFLISCNEILSSKDREAYGNVLILHASDLPRGRGWSPHIWDIINGHSSITLSMVEATDKVDSGKIWNKIKVMIPKYALWDEINSLLFKAEIYLINFAVKNYSTIKPYAQTSKIQPTYYPKRLPEDSRVDPNLSLASQFDKIRVCDPNRYPAFFELHGQRYTILLERLIDDTDKN